MSVDALKMKNAAVGYHGRVLIGNISFSVEEGEILSLIGPNGAGKSTILKSITRQLKLISGDVVLYEKNMQSLSAAAIADHMSVLLTEKIKEGYLTAFDVAAMGRYPHTGKMGILSDKDREIVKKALQLTESYELADVSFQELSDGQKQRVLLARALAQEPKVLVLDEPTTYLDIRYRMKLMDLLRDLSRREKITVILSLHEIDAAARISDRILMVRNDHTVTIGTPEEIFEGREIEKLFQIDSKRYDPLLGTTELKRPDGNPEVLVISSGGTGIPVYRKLAREGIPFSAGILYENDLDYRYACLLASEVISEKPFMPISDQTFRLAEERICSCKKVMNAGIEIGTVNEKINTLLKTAENQGKLIKTGLS